MNARRVPRSTRNSPIRRAEVPAVCGTAAGLTAPVPSGESLYIPTRLVVLVIVIICYVGGFVGLLQAGHDPLDIVSVLYLASGGAVDVVRRLVGLMRR
ncbi:hypothetical protein [Streptomyces salinarius]|uniref:hypothetical protein n=1 Tax=Streptomyces salinarius TaxID=2762598 RepID=UPI0016482F31|nr:hypothetical protein [Streptomyces salinarius]